jgi:hypothetical protein
MNPRAPRFYGAWVEGRYYQPGSFLPRGTTAYSAVEIMIVPEGMRARIGADYITVVERFAVGAILKEIADTMRDKFERILARYPE